MLSQSWPFTVEFDNEAEHRIAHWTTNGGRAPPRRDALARVAGLWVNVLQYIGVEGIRVGDLHALGRTDRDLLAGLQRWGYVTTEPDVKTIGAGRVATTWWCACGRPGGRAAEVWRPLAGEIEQRWRSRFGDETVEALRRALAAVRDRFDWTYPSICRSCSPRRTGRRRSRRRRDGCKTSERDADRCPRPLGAARPGAAAVHDRLRGEIEDLPSHQRQHPPCARCGRHPCEGSAAADRSVEGSEHHGGGLSRTARVRRPRAGPSGGRGKVCDSRQGDRGRRTSIAGCWRRPSAGRSGTGGTDEGSAGVLASRRDAGPLRSRCSSRACSRIPTGGGRPSHARTLPHYPMVLHRGGLPRRQLSGRRARCRQGMSSRSTWAKRAAAAGSVSKKRAGSRSSSSSTPGVPSARVDQVDRA